MLNLARRELLVNFIFPPKFIFVPLKVSGY